LIEQVVVGESSMLDTTVRLGWFVSADASNNGDWLRQGRLVTLV
jgi:hypothetical protein